MQELGRYVTDDQDRVMPDVVVVGEESKGFLVPHDNNAPIISVGE